MEEIANVTRNDNRTDAPTVVVPACLENIDNTKICVQFYVTAVIGDIAHLDQVHGNVSACYRTTE